MLQALRVAKKDDGTAGCEADGEIGEMHHPPTVEEEEPINQSTKPITKPINQSPNQTNYPTWKTFMSHWADWCEEGKAARHRMRLGSIQVSVELG